VAAPTAERRRMSALLSWLLGVNDIKNANEIAPTPTYMSNENHNGRWT